MHREGHYGASLLAYAPIGFVVIAVGYPVAGVGGGALAVMLAMLPDTDLQIPGIKHRGVTHTVQFAAIVGVPSGALVGAVAASAPTSYAPIVAGIAGFVFGFVTGAVSIVAHIAADALTPMGVTPFGEDGPHITFDVCRADNPIGNYGLLILGGTAALGAFYLGEAVNAAL